MQGRSFAARLAFCAELIASLPSPPIELDARDGETVDLALNALRGGLSQEELYLKGLSAGLLPIVRVTERRAAETEKRKYKPGDNYGFSGAADTSSERYRYTAVFLRVLSSALTADVAQTADGFRGAMRLHAVYSCDTDPKGAVRIAIEEAGIAAEDAIALAFRAARQSGGRSFLGPRRMLSAMGRATSLSRSRTWTRRVMKRRTVEWRRHSPSSCAVGASASS